MAKSKNEVSKRVYAEDMPFELMKEKILQNWKLDHIPITEQTIEGSCDYHKYCCDVWNSAIPEFKDKAKMVRVGDDAKIKTEVSVPFNGTNITVKMDEEGVRTCKTVFGSFEDFTAACEDVRVFELLAIKDSNGKHRIDAFQEFEGKEMQVLFFTVGAYYFIEQMWELVDEYTIDEVMDTQKVVTTEQRAMCLAVPKIARQLDKKLKQHGETYVEPRDNGTYTLFKGKLEGTDVTYVRCFCPSTDRIFMLSCENKYDNPKEAIASLCMIPKDVVGDIETISRQGEIFLATFCCDTETDEFKQKLKSTPVSLTGEQYFSKLVYES